MTPTEMQALKATLEEAERIKDERLSSTQESIRDRYRFDPLGFVMAEWPWGVVGGPLEHATGPDDNQRQFLIDLGSHVRANNFDGHTAVRPVRMSISSAHGCGKSTMGAWICWWILRTRPMSVGTVTAGTYQQLETRTWADIMHWGRMCRGAADFDIQKSGVYHRVHREKWKVNPKTAKAENAQSFAGQHANTSTSWQMFDEASEVPNKNWLAAYSTLTDGEPMMFAWGQMIQNSGEFYNVTFGGASSRWDYRVWDGRVSQFTNKKTLQEWLEDWGEESDYYRVRVLGLPPRASSLQFIGQQLIDDARERVHKPLPDEPLVWGFDAANGGMAKFCFWARRGLDAKTIPPIFLPGDTKPDVVAAKAAELMADRRPAYKAAAMFCDQAFGAVIIVRLQALGFTNTFEVNFGDSSLDKHFLNMRAQMWSTMKDWLALGAVYDDEKIAQQFMAPGFHHKNGKLVLESKQDMAKRGVKSLDGADALALTFAQKVAPPPLPQKPVIPTTQRGGGSLGWFR